MGIVCIYEVIYHMIFISGFHLNDFWKKNECPLNLCLFIIPSIDEKKKDFEWFIAKTSLGEYNSYNALLVNVRVEYIACQQSIYSFDLITVNS